MARRPGKSLLEIINEGQPKNSDENKDRGQFMSPNEAKLIEDIIETDFGLITKKVAIPLLTVQEMAIGPLINHSKMPKEAVEKALLILIQHNCARFRNKVSMTKTQKIGEAADAAKKPAEMSVYSLVVENISARLRFPHYIRLVRQRFGVTEHATRILEQIMERGKLNMDKYREIVQEASDLRRDEISWDRVFETMINENYLMDAAIDESSGGSSLNTGFSFEEDTNKRVYWKINNNRLDLFLRNEYIVEHVSQKYGGQHSNIITSMFRILDSTLNPQQTVSNTVSVQEMVERSKTLKADAEGVMIRYLETMAAGIPPVVSSTPGGQGRTAEYQINMKSVTLRIKHGIVESWIHHKFGPNSARIYRLIQERKYLELNTISTISMVPIKEARCRVYDMFIANVIYVKEVARTADRQPGKTIFLWYGDLDLLIEKLIGDMQQGLYNARKRLRIHMKNNKDIISKNAEIEEQKMAAQREMMEEFVGVQLSEKEHKRLDTIENLQGQMELSILQLDMSILLLKSYPCQGRRVDTFPVKVPEGKRTGEVPDDSNVPHHRHLGLRIVIRRLLMTTKYAPAPQPHTPRRQYLPLFHQVDARVAQHGEFTEKSGFSKRIDCQPGQDTMVKKSTLTSSDSQYSETSFTVESLMADNFRELEELVSDSTEDDSEFLSLKLCEHFSSKERIYPLLSWLVKREEDPENFEKPCLTWRTLYHLIDSDLTNRFLLNALVEFGTSEEKTNLPLRFLQVLIASIDDVPVNVRRILLTVHQCVKTPEHLKTQLPLVAIYFLRKIILPFLSTPSTQKQCESQNIGSLAEELDIITKEGTHDQQMKDAIREWFELTIEEKQIEMYERLIACSAPQDKSVVDEDRKFIEWISQLRGPSSMPQHSAERTHLHQLLQEKMNCKTWKLLDKKEEENFSFYNRKEAGIASGAMKVLTKVHLPLKEAANAWVSGMWRDDPMVKSYDIQPVSDDGLFLAQCCLKFPMPFSNRFYAWYIHEQWSEKKLIRMGWNAPHPGIKNAVLGAVHLQGEVFEEVEPGVTNVTQIVHVSTKGNFPLWLENASLKLQGAKFRKFSQKVNREALNRSPQPQYFDADHHRVQRRHSHSAESS
ncbi:hypothetical protein PROFUN_08834 [Planoprotostelium fungivorum]|uniref:DNA-directed RNA polymerase III subunit RPC3 n=1 Tax=Planoprotostelium fungivorum TaxID=1890364 RepID=A0A2P6NIX9_9EUKA|nr:hypothetical protein PROFUN_08834 [Planoprotostelium fungivorum]